MPLEEAQPGKRRPWYGGYPERPGLLTAAAVVVGLALLVLGVALGGGDSGHVVPLATVVAAVIAAIMAYLRHVEQTKADVQRRITESFTKAVEQLGSDKLQVRIGGIYALERISRESADDYWTIMETLTAFVRWRSWRRNDEDAAAPVTVARHDQGDANPPLCEPLADIAAALTVI